MQGATNLQLIELYRSRKLEKSIQSRKPHYGTVEHISSNKFSFLTLENKKESIRSETITRINFYTLLENVTIGTVLSLERHKKLPAPRSKSGTGTRDNRGFEPELNPRRPPFRRRRDR